MAAKQMTLVGLVLCVLVGHAWAHVALTYPPARRLDLDFLDNSRTKPPCGMPKGTLKTSFLAGSTITVHWHLAYAHKGGFSLRILDELERPVLDLTPRAGGTEFVRDDVTAQKYEVRLPGDFTCTNCTLQLQREAGEWGPTYRFWSCADIDIVQRKDYHETCSGHGFHILGRCKCHKAHSGPRCQFADECSEDGDCGLRGKCLDINATESPTRMCYCPFGFYGKGCNKKAPWKEKALDLTLYTKRELSKRFTLYWRVLKDAGEIEVIMMVNGTSYAGVGWRPQGLTKQCKNFPVLGSPPDQATSTLKPEPLPEPEPKSEPEAKPEPKPEPEPEPSAEPKAEPEPSAEPKAEPEPEPAKPVPNSIQEPKPEPSNKAEPNDVFENDNRNKRVAMHSLDGLDFKNLGNDVTVKTSVSYKVSSSKGRGKRAAQNPSDVDTPKYQSPPNSESTPEPVSEPESNREPETTTAPKSEPKSNLKPKLKSKFVPKSKQLSNKPQSEKETEPSSFDPDLDHKSSSEPTAEPESTLEPKSEPEPSSEPKSEPEPLPEPKSEPEPTPEPKSEPEPIPEPKSEPEPIPEPKSEPEPEPTSEPESTPEPKSEPEPTPEPKSEPEPTPEPKSEPEPTPEPKSEPEPTPEPKAEPEPSPEPKSEPEPTPEPKSEPEPSSEPTLNGKHIPNKTYFEIPDPKSEPEPIAEPKSEPEPTAEPKPEPEPSPEPKSEPEPFPEPEPSSEPTDEAEMESLLVKGLTEESGYFPDHEYSPKFDFNGMDCTDLVIGTARGAYHRVLDYYTRDRSTPRVDTFWGGHDDITASSGFEENGVTTIMFRRKIKAKEPTDHSFVDDLMHVIWAHGQERSLHGDFYRPDEIKYHGHGQRGVASINFFEETKSSAMGGLSALEGDKCGGQWKLPADCDVKNNTCEYHASWEYLGLKRGKDSVRFTIKTKHTKLWTGIGFSNNKKMSQTDTVIGWVDPKTGRPFVMDAWVSGYSMPRVDQRQDITKQSVSLVDGFTTVSFVRKRDTGDQQDVAFTDSQCVYMMFVTQGGTFDAVNKRTSKHQRVPFVTDERVCIKPCGPEPVEEEITTEAVIPGEAAYNMLVRITGLADSFKPPAVGSKEFEELSAQVVDVFGRELARTKGYKGLIVNGFMQNETKAIIAELTLKSIDLNTIEGSSARSLDDSVSGEGNTTEQESDMEKWERVVRDTILQGRVGNLNVDPLFLAFEPSSLVSTRPTMEEEGPRVAWWGGPGGKLYVVVACVGALVLLALLQAACTLGAARARKSKDQLIPHNAWKDYPSANTNYAFEPFENDDKFTGTGTASTAVLRTRAPPTRPTSPPPPRPSSGHKQHNGQKANGTKSNGHRTPEGSKTPMNGTTGRSKYPNSAAQYYHETRSLQRPRSQYGSYGVRGDRAAYSLPRGPRAESAPQPDFYFMPSQRKHEDF